MGRTRDRVLEAIRTAGQPLGVEEIAAAVGLGLNSVRHHLAALESEGLVQAGLDRAGRPGRPRRLFTPGPGPVGPYERLALALLHARRTGASLEAAGRAVAPRGRDVLGFLAEEGFDPLPTPDGGLVLAACPLAHAAQVDPATVCGVHRGLVAGLAEGQGEELALVVGGPGRCRIIPGRPATTPRTTPARSPKGTLMTATLPTHDLADLVHEAPQRAEVFDRLGLDYCCHGGRTLEQACREAGLPLEEALGALRAADAAAAADTASTPEPLQRPLALSDAAGLVDTIVAGHHHYLREEMPALLELAGKVAVVHGARHPELTAVRDLVAALKDDLLPHMDREELVLFPAIRHLAAAGATRRSHFIGDEIGALMAEHETAGTLLAELRRLTDDYRPPADACASYQSLCTRLAHLEADTHFHIHTEQNVLFPLVTASNPAA